MWPSVNIRELAQVCGVSPATVSRVVNGNAPVHPETRQKIEEAMEQHGYIPRPQPRPRRKEPSGMIGVLLPSLRHDFFQLVMEQIDRLLEKSGRQMVIFPSHFPDVLERIRRVPLDGIILLCEETDRDTVGQLGQMGLSMVMCGALSLTKGCSAVHVDDLAAAYDGTNYLLGLGHRKIVFISDSPRSISSGFQRIAGSRKAMEDYGLLLTDDMLYSEGSDYHCGYRGATLLMKKNPGTTAVFAHSDSSAIGAMAALHDLGLRVPENVSVLGFDDIDAGERCRPRLTCVHQPIDSIVTKSLELLLEEMEGEQGNLSSITLPHSITLRESCKEYTEESGL